MQTCDSLMPQQRRLFQALAINYYKLWTWKEMNSVHALVVNGDGEFPRYEWVFRCINTFQVQGCSICVKTWLFWKDDEIKNIISVCKWKFMTYEMPVELLYFSPYIFLAWFLLLVWTRPSTTNQINKFHNHLWGIWASTPHLVTHVPRLKRKHQWRDMKLIYDLCFEHCVSLVLPGQNTCSCATQNKNKNTLFPCILNPLSH